MTAETAAPGPGGLWVEPADPPDSGRSRSRQGRTSLVVVVLILILFAGAAWTHRWVTEDAFINFRIVDQLFAGNGPVFNAGERVEAGTSPLWLAVLAIGRVVTLGRVEPGWVSVALGLSLTVSALAAGIAGARWVGADRKAPASRYVPAGLLIVAALPPMWDFATSGLETSLSFAWLGCCFWQIAKRSVMSPNRSAAEPRALLVLIGLGPLIRPDFAVFSAAYFAAVVIASAPGRRARARALGTCLAFPLVAEVTRMAYFASTVPNTAIAKEAGAVDWPRGWTYLLDFVQPYALLLPLLAAVVLWVMLPFQRWIHSSSWGRIAIVVAPVASGLVSIVYVVRLGGDFMHARMLLPAVFAIALPLFVWVPGSDSTPAASRRVGIVAVGVIAAWSVAASTTLRIPYHGGVSAKTDISDERGFYVGGAGTAHPVTAEDYASTAYARFGEHLEDLRRAGKDVLVLADGTELALPAGTGVVAIYGQIGIAGFIAGPEVHLVDPLGLSDPLAARMKVSVRRRAGHEKSLDNAWVFARFGANEGDPSTTDAAHALKCGSLDDLLRSTTDPLSLDLLLRNLARSIPLTTLRIDPEPDRAAEALCP